MRKSAVAAGTLAAVGLMAAGGTAFADSGASAPEQNGQDVQNTSQSSSTVVDTGNTEEQGQVHTLPVSQGGDNAAHTEAGANRSVVGVAAPINADLHEGVANNLNVSDVVHLGKTNVPANVTDVVKLPVANQATAPVNAVTGGDATAQANAQSANGTDAVAQATALGGVGSTVDGVVATATSTVNNVLATNGGVIQVAR